MGNQLLPHVLYFSITLLVLSIILMAKKKRFNEVKVFVAIIATSVLIALGMWGYKEFRKSYTIRSVESRGVEIWAKVQSWEYGNRHRPHRRRVAPSSMHFIEFEFWIGDDKYHSVYRTHAATLNQLETMSADDHDTLIFIRIKYDPENPNNTILIHDSLGNVLLTTTPEP